MTNDSRNETTHPQPHPELWSFHLEHDGLRRTCEADLVFLERYEGWDEVGHGSRGVVVRTFCRDQDSTVALKVMPRHADGDPHRFQVEAKLLARITHPCVVRTYSAFKRGPLAWIEMEYVEGSSLGQELRRRRDEGEPWLLDEALEIAAAAASGLAAVHARGVVHHDVKPDNLLLPSSREPAAKLADFGLARLLDAASPAHAGAIPGTPLYCAPELVHGAAAGPPADVYALCVTLFQLFADGTHPYALDERATVSEIVHAHTRQAPIPLRSLAPCVPRHVADTVARGLDKTPASRPSAQDLADALCAAVAARHEPAEVQEDAVPVWRWRCGLRVAVAVMGVSMLMLTSVLAAWRYITGTTTPDDRALIVATAPVPLPADQAPRWSTPSPGDAQLHVTWAAPGVVGIYNEGRHDLVDVVVQVAGETYPVGDVAADEEAWIFANGEGAVSAEGQTREGARVVGTIL